MKKLMCIGIITILLIVTGCRAFPDEPFARIDTSKDDKELQMTQLQSNDAKEYGFVDKDNRYGNSLETVGYLHRRIVANGDKIFVGLGGLFQCNLDGSDKQIFLEQPIGQISFYDGWIYFSNCYYWSRFFDSDCLYRIRPNGSNLQIIYDNSDNESGKFMNFQIVNDRIYMDSSYRFNGTDMEGFGIQSMSLTGGDITNICAYPESSLIIVSDKIYYQYNKEIYCTDLDGSNNQFAIDITDMGLFAISGGYIYFHSTLDNCLYRVEIEGGAPQLIMPDVNQTLEYMFIKDGYLYYVYPYLDDKIEVVIYNLARVLINGGVEELICSNITRKKYTELTPTVIGDWIYYQSNGLEMDNLFRRVKLDSSEEISLPDWFINTPEDSPIPIT